MDAAVAERPYRPAVRLALADLMLAAAVGALSGALALGTRALLLAITSLTTNNHAFAGAFAVDTPNYGSLGVATRLVLPLGGGLLCSWLIVALAPETHGQGVAPVQAAVRRDGPQIRARVIVVKPVVTGLTIGAGGSAGLVAPVVHIGAALGSKCAAALRLPADRARLLVGCGAAAAIAALFGAPIGAGCFALEVVLATVAVRSVASVAVAALAGATVSRLVLGGAPMLDVPPVDLTAIGLLLAAVLGVLCSFVACLFVRTFHLFAEVLARAWRGPQWLLPAACGALLGLLFLVAPELWGIGLPVVQAALTGHYAIIVLLALLVGKIVANSLTVNYLGSGGSFTPLLFVGAMFGSAFGHVAATLAMPGGPLLYGLAAMAAVVAAATRAPFAAAFIVIEMSGTVSVALPIAVAVIASTATSHLFCGATIYLKRVGAATGAR